MNFLEVLTIVFIILKLTNVIFWSWLWVLAPLWIPLALYVGFWSIVFVIVGIEALIDDLNWRK